MHYFFRYNNTQYINHTCEDSVKNLVNATDILPNVMCKYSRASICTMKKVNIYSIHIIQKRMSLVRYSLKNKQCWQAIECGSAKMPLVFAERKQMLKVLNLFAFIYASFSCSSFNQIFHFV